MIRNYSCIYQPGKGLIGESSKFEIIWKPSNWSSLLLSCGCVERRVCDGGTCLAHGTSSAALLKRLQQRLQQVSSRIVHITPSSAIPASVSHPPPLPSSVFHFSTSNKFANPNSCTVCEAATYSSETSVEFACPTDTPRVSLSIFLNGNKKVMEVLWACLTGGTSISVLVNGKLRSALMWNNWSICHQSIAPFTVVKTGAPSTLTTPRVLQTSAIIGRVSLTAL